MRFLAFVAALLAAPALASNVVDNIAIVPAGDGSLYSEFIDGDVTPPPPYEALVLSIGSALATAGIEAIQCGTGGTDFSHDVRQYLTGTNAATADISVVNPTGDDWATAGGNDPGSGDDLTFECADPDVSLGGAITIRATDCPDTECSTDDSTVKPWASLAQSGGGGGGIDFSTRNIIFGMDFETGAITDRDTTDSNGVYHDAARLANLEPDNTFLITDVTNANPAVITWSGADPDFTNDALSGANSTTGNAGFTFPVISSGMTELSEAMVRCDPATINTTTNKCSLKIDGTTVSTSDGDADLGDNNLNASGFGTWGPDATATFWKQVAYEAAGSLGPSATNDIHVVATKTPPNTLTGSSPAVFYPRSGNFFLTTEISKDHDYSAMNGQTSKNKPRFHFLFEKDGPLDISNNEVSCVGASIALPSNYDHNDSGTVNNTENQLVRMARTDAQDEAAWSLSIAHGSGGVDKWNFTVDSGTHDPALQIDANLGLVSDSIGKWTDFLVYFKLDDNDGFVEVWRRYADNTASSNKNATAWEQVYTRGPGVGVGHTYANKFILGLRNYKYSWLHKTGTTPSYHLWYGIDDLYLTRFVTDGGTCADVTVDGSDPT